MKDTKTDAPSEISASQSERRAFMEKAGRLAVYTSPLMLGLLLPGEHAIASGGYHRNGGNNQGEDGNDQGEDGNEQ